MRELRNPDYRREWIVYTAVTAALALAGLLAVSPLGGALVLLCGAALGGTHAVFTRRRYRAIGELSRQMDAILHGQESLRIDENEEGELSILRSEVQKMTLRLRENADALRSDKRYLTRTIEDIFHQLRTPLTAMNLEVSLLRAEELPYERRLELTRELKKQLRHVNWLVETLLKMSQLDAGTMSLRSDSVAVRELLEKAAAPLAIPMELRGQTLCVKVGKERFTGDLRWSAEALGNILKNCAEHTPEGGTVTVTAEETPIFTQIVVHDTGPGFDPADIPHLFERFYRGTTAGDGSIGIGLAMSRMVIAAQNGTVTADNPPDGGARFTIRFYKSII
ncbi:MAG: HAMP domain-containing histidine kinase [Oscillospiraceae bacterium]|nr:HAMP domain-containing histidine kinase [Oscillospiraceae bacterium]